jgi:hypothetical protein
VKRSKKRSPFVGRQVEDSIGNDDMRVVCQELATTGAVLVNGGLVRLMGGGIILAYTFSGAA